MNTNIDITRTEESVERPSYRIRNSSSQQLKQINRRKNSSQLESLKDSKVKATSSISLQKDGFKQFNLTLKQNTQSDTQAHHEKVASLLKKINGNDSTQQMSKSSVSTSNIIMKRAIQSRGEHNQRLNTTSTNNQSIQNNNLFDSKILDKSINPKQTADVLTNMGSVSILKGSKSKQSDRIRSKQDGQDSTTIINSKQQQARFTSFDDFYTQSLDNIDQSKLGLNSTEQLQQQLLQSAKQRGKVNEYINVQQHSNNQSNNQTPQVRRKTSSRLKTDDKMNEDQVQVQVQEKENAKYFDQRGSTQLAHQHEEDLEQIKEFNADDIYKMEYFNQFATNLTSKSQHTSKNLYTNNDSRFKLINQLRNKNYFLENVITDLKGEINEVDEFKAVLDKYGDGKELQDEVISNINQEKRIMLLKAQINKQQRHIKSLNTLLTQSRKCFKEVLDVCYYLLDNITTENNQFGSQTQQNSHAHQAYFPKSGSIQSSKQNNAQSNSKSQNNQNSAHQNNNQNNNANNNNQGGANGAVPQRGSQVVGGETDTNLPKTEEAMQIFFNSVSQNQAHKQLYSVLVGIEDRRKFVDNFNAAFSKVVQFQYKSEEFKKLFTIKRSKFTQQAEIKFNHPIRLLFDQFQNCFPVHTLFDFLDSSQKQNTQNKLVSIVSLLRKTDRSFKKIRSYQLFKHNPACFREQGGQGDISIPNLLLENQKLFADFMQARGHSRMISLNFERIMKTESSLGQLLDKIVNYLGFLQLKGEYSLELSDMIQNLRKGCEDLICLGILIPNDQGSMQQRISIISESEQRKYSSQLESQMSLDETQQQQQKQPNTHEWFNYDQKMDVHTEFNEKRGTLAILFDEFSSAASVKDYKSCNDIVPKIGNLLESFKGMFESKDNIIKLKSFEIAYLRNQQALRVADWEAVQEFIEQLQGQIHILLQPINQKLNVVVNTVTQLIDNSRIIDHAQRQNLIYTFKKNMKEILENIKRILNNQFSNNQINILSLEQQFQQRVQLAQQRFSRLKPVISKPVIM